MMISSLFAVSFLFLSTLASPVTNHAFLYERATTAFKVPQTTPTGSLCTQTTQTAANVSPLEIAGAVIGCQGIVLPTTNDVRNDILDGICKPFTLIFARGTSENPNIGNIVGPPFVLALQEALGAENVAVQGVNDYQANAAQYCMGGSLPGSQDMASLIKLTQKQCPDTKLCISGYSQGCQLVHNAAEILASDKNATAFVNSVVLFGDPDNGLPVGNIPSSKVSTDCHQGDNICQDGELVKQPHLTYCHDVGKEAAFAKARSGL